MTYVEAILKVLAVGHRPRRGPARDLCHRAGRLLEGVG